MFSQCTISASTAEKTASAGRQLAQSLYRKNLTILLTGELGVGKTTFAQGFASGLGIEDRVVSPTYALEQRHEAFTHIDLYRLTEAQAKDFLQQSEGIEGIRLIEWAERIDRNAIGPHIRVHIDDIDGVRKISFDYLDDPVPEDSEIDAWMREVHLPGNIMRHIAKVTEVADEYALTLVKSRHMPLRREALHAAARTHDLLRFVDFKTWNGDPAYAPTDADRKIWGELKDRYGTPHEEAAKKFLCERGYDGIGEIVSAHRGMDDQSQENANTTEQKILAYADKRVMFDRRVTLNARFEDFVSRYGNGKESEHHRKWLGIMKRMEAELFPEGAPET